jgi:uncharacterized protein (TIGR00251 family)
VSRAKRPGLPAEPASPERSEPTQWDRLAVRPATGGTLLPVRVTPRAGRTALDGVIDGALRVRLTAPPVDGAANVALIACLADQLRLPKSAVTIVAGAAARTKTLHIAGLTPEGVRARLRATGTSG